MDASSPVKHHHDLFFELTIIVNSQVPLRSGLVVRHDLVFELTIIVNSKVPLNLRL